jgi:hypothetical protein
MTARGALAVRRGPFASTRERRVQGRREERE